MGDDAADEMVLSDAREEHGICMDGDDCVDGAVEFIADAEGGETDFPRFGVDNRTYTDDGSLHLCPTDNLKLELTWQGMVGTAAAIAFFLASPPA